MDREVMDYSNDKHPDTDYCVPGFNNRIVKEQNMKQPRYCEPGEAGGEMQGAHRNVQAGP